MLDLFVKVYKLPVSILLMSQLNLEDLVGEAICQGCMAGYQKNTALMPCLRLLKKVSFEVLSGDTLNCRVSDLAFSFNVCLTALSGDTLTCRASALH